MTIADETRRQQTLLRVLLRDEGPEKTLAHLMHGGGHTFERGLQAYRAHARALAVRVLAAVYPTLQPLLGEAAFAALARTFWRHSPPADGDLGLWGEDLPAFVAAAPDLAAEPYLADVARLDWAVHRAATAADQVAVAFSLQQMAQLDSTALRLVPQAGTALLVSAYPVVSIWHAHHGAADRFAPAREALHQGRAETALVWRQGWRVQVAALAAPEAHFTAQVLQGSALGSAWQRTADTGPFDFQAWLLLQLQRGWLAGADSAAPA